MFYFYLAFFLLIWAIFAFRDWQKAVSVLPIFFPAYLLRLKWAVPFTLLELLIYLTFLVFLFRHKFDTTAALWQRFKYPVALFLLAATVSLLVVPDQMQLVDGTVVATRKVALGIWKGWIVAPLLYWVLLTQITNKKEAYLRAMNSLEVSGVFLGLIALYQVFSGHYITPDGRASGPFESANYLALYLTPIFVYQVIKLLLHTERSWSEKALLFLKRLLEPKFRDWFVYVQWFNFAVIGLALFFSKSFAAWMAVFVSLIFYYALSDRKIIYEKFIAGLFLLIFFVVIFGSQANSDKFRTWFKFNERSSTSVRLEVWQIAGQFIAERPILGIGLGQFPYHYNRRAAQILGRAPTEWTMLHPHSVAGSFWLSTGLLGLIAFLWILVMCLAYLKERLSTRQKNMILLSQTMLMAILLHGIFDTAIWKNDLFMEFWLIIGTLGWAREWA